MKLTGLSKVEIKEALERGFKVRHRYFGSQEYVFKTGESIRTEEGYTTDQNVFWGDRIGSGFDTDWSILEEEWMQETSKITIDVAKKLLYLGYVLGNEKLDKGGKFRLRDGLIYSSSDMPIIESNFWLGQKANDFLSGWYVIETPDGTKYLNQGTMKVTEQHIGRLRRDIGEKSKKVYDDVDISNFKLFRPVFEESLALDPSLVDDTEDSIRDFRHARNLSFSNQLIGVADNALKGADAMSQAHYTLKDDKKILIMPPNYEASNIPSIFKNSTYGSGAENHPIGKTIHFTDAMQKFGKSYHTMSIMDMTPMSRSLQATRGSIALAIPFLEDIAENPSLIDTIKFSGLKSVYDGTKPVYMVYDDEHLEIAKKTLLDVKVRYATAWIRLKKRLGLGHGLDYNNTEPPLTVYNLNFLIEIAIDANLIDTMTGVGADDTYDGKKPIFMVVTDPVHIDSAKKSLEWFKENHRNIWNRLKENFIRLHGGVKLFGNTTATTATSSDSINDEHAKRMANAVVTNIEKAIQEALSANQHDILRGAVDVCEEICEFVVDAGSDAKGSFSLNDHSVVTAKFATGSLKNNTFQMELGVHVDGEKIEKAMRMACSAHASENDLYAGLPYRIHLQLAFYFGCKFTYLIKARSKDLTTNALASIWTHDLIENLGAYWYSKLKDRLGYDVAEMTFALTPLRGRIRRERYGDEYFKGINETGIAIFVKHCDRLANIFYSYTNGNDGKLAMYRKEQEYYESQLIGNRFVDMIELMKFLLKQ